MRISLYLHYPFCLKKCHYCDFNSTARGTLPPREYAGLLLKEMELRRALLPEGVTVPTLYFGGGTPSLMEPRLVAALVDAAARLFALDGDAEVTLEANPGTVTPESLAGYRAAGVNRLSFGIQSFEDRLLAKLGRVHSAAEGIAAFEAARRAGFDNVSIDLMHSLPEQTPDDWRRALARAVALAPEHVSAYALSVECGTPFELLQERGELPLPTEEAAACMFEDTIEVLGKHGYEHYEISNFALPGRTSRHNGVYWSRGSYLGIGAGAHSFRNPIGELPLVTSSPSPPPPPIKGGGKDSEGTEEKCGLRWKNCDGIEEYQRAISDGILPEEELQTLSLRDAVSESFFLGLRRLSGVDLAHLEERYGAPALEEFCGEIARLVQGGALLSEGGKIRLAPSAVIVANSVFSRFL